MVRERQRREREEARAAASKASASPIPVAIVAHGGAPKWWPMRHLGKISLGLVMVTILVLFIEVAKREERRQERAEQARMEEYDKQRARERQAEDEQAEQLKKEFGGMELKRIMQTREHLVEVTRLIKAEHITQDEAELRIQREFDRTHPRVDVGPLYEEVQRRVKQQGISEREAVNQILREKGQTP
jgi:hypothetical protein